MIHIGQEKKITGFGFFEPDRKLVIKASASTAPSITTPENVDHQATIRMREIKDRLSLTARQFVKELNEFESSKKQSERVIDTEITSSYVPFTPVMLSSYLQGRVLQESYISAALRRMEDFYAHKMQNQKEHRQLRQQYHNMTKVVDDWMKALKIDPAQGSPYRALAAKINPFYKRAVFTPIPGIFKLGIMMDGDLQSYTIVNSEHGDAEYVLNANEHILVKDDQKLLRGDVIQFSLPIKSTSNGCKVSQKMALNQSTFFRWHTNNSPPKSAKIIEQVNEAVLMAVGAIEEQGKHP